MGQGSPENQQKIHRKIIRAGSFTTVLTRMFIVATKSCPAAHKLQPCTSDGVSCQPETQEHHVQGEVSAQRRDRLALRPRSCFIVASVPNATRPHWCGQAFLNPDSLPEIPLSTEAEILINNDLGIPVGSVKLTH